ncbi:hypothetical protein MVEN_01863300 [Mycena venus]|uniref:Uncharacterized protein n=1 Tax=Mycena venus TaxID=2733690 RepID=A0A8H6XHH5_9AGAR|nr:hypothetical protein MVEN_01863300 [Mycena venus]
MLSAKLILTVLAFIAISSAAPSPEAGLAPRVSAAITVCTGSLNPSQGCLEIPVVSDACINFIGGLTFFNKEVSSSKIPGGFVCTFFEDFGCSTDDGVALLTGGSWNMEEVEGLAGIENFNDLTSSISCSPV